MGISTSPSCPAYWPELIWQIHHPLVGPEPESDPRYQKLDAHFAALAIRELTPRLAAPGTSIDPKVLAGLREAIAPFMKGLGDQ